MRGNDVLQWFADSVARHPARAALECGPRRLSYGDLDRWSDDLARRLRGGAPGAVAAVCVADPIERVVSLLGVLKGGCAFAPVDLEQPAPRLRHLLEHIAPRWLIGDPADARTAAALAAIEWSGDARWCRLDPDHLAARCDADAVAAVPPASAAGSPGPDDLCYLFQTSGSTGIPQCIAGRFRGIGHFVRWEVDFLGLAPGVRVSQLTSPYFDAYLRDVFVPLSAGGTLCIPETPEVRLGTDSLARWIEARQVELVHCVPSLFHVLCAADLHPRAFERLRHVLLAGEPPLHADLARWFGAFGERVRIVNLYGPTETTMTKLFHEVRPADLRRRSIPIGRPMAGAAALLVDGAGRPCAPGTIGEILLRTPYRSLGYFEQPRLTAERFVRNPWSPDPDGPDAADDLVYRTGDLGRLLPDGALELLGRRDQQVKVRGQRIELAEVESALGEHPGVLAAAAVARPDADGLPALWAFVVLRAETPPRALREWMARAVPAYLTPDRLVPVAELPRTRNGKLDRRALAALDVDGRQGAEPPVEPRTPTERRLVEIWQEVIEVAQSGVRDDFFAAGGHSLMATRLLLRVRAAFGVEVPLRDFLDRPTIEALAERVDEAILLAADPARIEELLRALEAEPEPDGVAAEPDWTAAEPG